MPRFEPFSGVLYDLKILTDKGARIDDVIAPPYDVIDPLQRRSLAKRSSFNSVLVELPVDDPVTSRNRYRVAADHLEAWLSEGVLALDPRPALYGYRMSFRDQSGAASTTTGVIGTLEVTALGGHVLTHERTMSKAKSDRLDLLRSCRANLSPVWGLSLAKGLSASIPSAPIGGMPPPEALVATDDEGVRHELWRITDHRAITEIAAAVSSAPVVIADGHHRYETALAYQAERRAANDDAPGDYDSVMALMVELSEDQLSVRPIHRLLSGLPDSFDLLGAMGESFEMVQTAENAQRLVAQMVELGALGLLTRSGAWLLHPRSKVEQAGPVDSSLLEAALEPLPPHEISYEPDLAKVQSALRSGDAEAAVLLKPPTIGAIVDAAWAGRRLPPKTTFFHPKPRTGLVFRPVRD